MDKQKKFDPKMLGLDERTSRAIAAFMGLGICDAFGAST